MNSSLPSDADRAARPASPARIFIVEDEAIISMELQMRLLDLGYVVSGTAARGEVALQKIPAAGADLVLMDVRLAGALDGIETAARLRELLPVPVVYLSAFSDPALRERAMQTAPAGFVGKPFAEAALRRTIEAALAGTVER